MWFKKFKANIAFRPSVYIYVGNLIINQWRQNKTRLTTILFQSNLLRDHLKSERFKSNKEEHAHTYTRWMVCVLIRLLLNETTNFCSEWIFFLDFYNRVGTFILIETIMNSVFVYIYFQKS